MAKSDRHQQASVAGMVLVRVFLGGFFLFQAYQFLADSGRIIRNFLTSTLAKGAFVSGSPWSDFDHFLINTVHTNAELFGWLLIGACALAGVLLLIGFLTRLGAIFAMAVSAFFLAVMWAAPAPMFGDYPPIFVHSAFLVMELAVLISAAGRTLGCDTVLAKKTKVKLLW